MRLKFNPFKTKSLAIAGRMNFNREVNSDKIVVDLETAREVLGYKNESTGYFVDLSEGIDPEKIREEIQSVIVTSI